MNYKIKFSPVDNKKFKGHTRIYGAKTRQHAVNILKLKRRNNGLSFPVILKIREVSA